jgi:hypothetical protein
MELKVGWVNHFPKLFEYWNKCTTLIVENQFFGKINLQESCLCA